MIEITDAYQFIPGSRDAPAFFTCEHASDRIPPTWTLSDNDARLLGTHWTYDLGAAEITRALARSLDAPAVLSTCSRLIVDVNRAPDSDTLFLAHAEDAVIDLNHDIDAAEREARMGAYYHPYHDAIDREIAHTSCELVFAVHSFTPMYQGQIRTMELGILFDEQLALAESMTHALGRAGFSVALNQPYSGKGGLMYSAEWHARAFEHSPKRRPIELEVRQDIAVDPAGRERVVQAITAWLLERQ